MELGIFEIFGLRSKGEKRGGKSGERNDFSFAPPGRVARSPIASVIQVTITKMLTENRIWDPNEMEVIFSVVSVTRHHYVTWRERTGYATGQQVIVDFQSVIMED